MPRPFPVGNWLITGKETTAETWLKPVKFITNATQDLDIWLLSDSGTYLRKSNYTIGDWGYRIHFANGSHHTDGCIGIQQLGDLLWLDSLADPFPWDLEVTE